MKKFAWIIALLAALSLTFFGCTEPDGSAYQPPRALPEEVVWKTIFDMRNPDDGTVTHGIQNLPVGALTFPESGDGPTAPIVKAGNMPDHISSFEIVDINGKKAMKYVTVATWGPGFDLPASAFGFRAGDKITITGTAAHSGTAIDLALNRNQGAAQQIIGNQIKSTGDFTVEAELTQADISAILANEQKVIRFEDRVGGTTVTITQVKIEGFRPVNLIPLEAPVVTLSGSTLSWVAVADSSGYKVYLNDDTAPFPIGTSSATTITATSINLFTELERQKKDMDFYTFKVEALGTSGVSTDSPKSSAVTYAYYYVLLTTEGVGDDEVVTHINPRFNSVAGGVNDFTFNALNKVTVPAAKRADFAYIYPQDIEGFDIDEWDFVTLTVETTGEVNNFAYKAYPSRTADATKTGTLTTDTETTIKVELRKSPQGLIFQKYAAQHGTPAVDDPAVSVEITSAVFEKGTRYTVTFDPLGGSFPGPRSTYLVEGTKVARHLPNPTAPGRFFLAWWLDEVGGTGTKITPNTDVTSAAFSSNPTLYAEWIDGEPAPITITDEDALLALIEAYGNSATDTNNAYKNTTDKTISVVASSAGNCTWGINFPDVIAKAIQLDNTIPSATEYAWYTGFTLKIKVVAGGPSQGNIKRTHSWGGDYVTGGIAGAASPYPNFPAATATDPTVTLNFPLTQLNGGLMSQANGAAFTFQVTEMSFHRDMF